jgi:hypothetical protein
MCTIFKIFYLHNLWGQNINMSEEHQIKWSICYNALVDFICNSWLLLIIGFKTLKFVVYILGMWNCPCILYYTFEYPLYDWLNITTQQQSYLTIPFAGKLNANMLHVTRLSAWIIIILFPLWILVKINGMGHVVERIWASVYCDLHKFRFVVVCTSNSF